MAPVLGVRWTIGEAGPETIELLVRSIRSVEAAYGRAAALAVCVHSVGAAEVRERVGAAVGRGVVWLQVDRDVPVFVRRRVDLSMADGAAWRFAPLRVFEGTCEIVLGADFILGPLASEVLSWARTPGQRRCLVAHDEPLRHGRAHAGHRPLMVRGIPRSFDLEDALDSVMSRGPELLASAEDVTAVELAALSCGGAPLALRPRRVRHQAPATCLVP